MGGGHGRAEKLFEKFPRPVVHARSWQSPGVASSGRSGPTSLDPITTVALASGHRDDYSSG
jgi:hypothetical protein